MRTNSLLVLAVMSAACSASTVGGTREPSVTPMASGMLPSASGTMNVGATAEVTAISTAVPVPPDSAFTLLRAVYAKLAIPVAQVDPAHRTIGNSGLKVRRQLAGVPMQKVLDCGDQIGVPNAETWDIQMDITSYVTADGKGAAQLWTRIQAVGSDPSVSGSNVTDCTTRGDLEAKIGNAVKLMTVSK